MMTADVAQTSRCDVGGVIPLPLLVIVLRNDVITVRSTGSCLTCRYPKGWHAACGHKQGSGPLPGRFFMYQTLLMKRALRLCNRSQAERIDIASALHGLASVARHLVNTQLRWASGFT